MSSFVDSLTRRLDEEVITITDDRFVEEEFVVVEDDDWEEDEYELPVWIAMLGVIFISTSIAAFVFYMSYKHELICGKRSDREDGEEEDQKVAEQLERGHGARVSVKKFADEEVPNFYALPEGTGHTSGASVETEESSLDSGSDGSNNNSNNKNENLQSVRTASTVSTRSSASVSRSFAALVTTPRCVLCSKSFADGEDVVHSNNPECHHEYHKTCLVKHWAKAKGGVHGKCPVCKETFHPDGQEEEEGGEGHDVHA
ncbi:expressed unknown protein [Seminavis robusta]|uniref:RING-type domain-containing protein n=1 Tax=Seminavis robusta TaxID=568900 RepID=A0A9N8DBM8_9STRA|nr:expressed unknown protein [Seminavis robusta]|eukprot:Sro78_g042420.1 n/a (257) ;mRNA; f:55370-56306